MSIGILVYSYTGNTLSVVKKIKEELEQNIDVAEIKSITLVNGDPNGGQPLVLKDIPDISKYDKLIVGAPINAFNLCRAMKMYFNHAKVNAKTVNCFVTQHFNGSFLGGNRGIKQLSKFFTHSGANLGNTAIVHWSSPKRDDEIAEAVKLMCDI